MIEVIRRSAGPSVPCPSTAAESQGSPFRAGGPSACQQVIREFETYIEGYRKAGGGIYGRCREQLPTAIQNAKRNRRSGRSSSTDVWKLVERLQELRALRRKRLPD